MAVARWVLVVLMPIVLIACGPPTGSGSGGAGATATAAPMPAPRPTATAPPVPTAMPASAAAPAATPAGAWISLSPDSGTPGTVVHMRGHVPGAPSAVGFIGQEWVHHGTICWAGCLDGLTIEASDIVWSSSTPDDFTLRFTVPAQPWLAANGPHALTAGDYAVGIQCVGVLVKGCAVMPAQATATFHVHGPTPTRCLPGQPCASLRFSPSAAAPGAQVSLAGWAPLTAISGQAMGYNLVLPASGVDGPVTLGQVHQALDGSLSGSFHVPATLPGQATFAPGTYPFALEYIHSVGPPADATPVAGATVTPIGKSPGGAERITLAATSFTVTASPSWQSLGAIRPIWVQYGGFNQAIQGDPQNPSRLAYCAPDGIHATVDGGSSWTVIPTAGAARAAAKTSYPLAASSVQTGGAPPMCVAVTLDPDHPASFFATFAAYKQAFGGIPPTYYAGYDTSDGGQTWQPVPVPSGTGADRFGGFQVNGRAAQVLFAGPSASGGEAPESQPAVIAEQTPDGGRTWHAVALACPGAGPCLRFGPLPSGIGSCAMHGYPQPILDSGDGGHTWSVSAWPDGANACASNELIAISPTDVLLLAGASPYPLLRSGDAGRTWVSVALPPPLGTAGADQAFVTAVMLPTGALLAATSGTPVWQLLPPGGAGWCAVAPTALPPTLSAVRAIGDRLWWLEAGRPPVRQVVPRSVALSNLQCNQSQHQET